MIRNTHAEGVVAMLVERFEGEHLGRLLALKAELEGGARLGERSSDFLFEVLTEALRSKHLVDRHPEYQDLYTRTVQLFKQITERALENEVRATAPEIASFTHMQGMRRDAELA